MKIQIEWPPERPEKAVTLDLPCVPAQGSRVEIDCGWWVVVVAVAYPLTDPVRVLCEPGTPPPPPPPP